VYPQDPPPYPQQPQPAPYSLSKEPAPQYPPTQAYPPAAQSYPPHPVGGPPPYPPYPVAAPPQYAAPQQYSAGPGYPQPGYGFPQGPYPPPKRTEFGWASIIVGSIALLTSVIPYFGIIGVLAAIVLVLAGWLGKHERSRIPAVFGTVITGLALVSTVIFTLLWRDIFRGFLKF
jgi:hypothetical protein